MATFQDLPAELRNYVYQLSLIHDDVIDLSTSTAVSRTLAKPNLLLTCRRICDEATGVFYGGNIFSAPSTRTALTFLKRLRPTSISSIRHFRVFGGLRLSIPARQRESHNKARRRFVDQLLNDCARLCGSKLMLDAVLVPSLELSGGRNGEEIWLRLKDVQESEVHDEAKDKHGDMVIEEKKE